MPHVCLPRTPALRHLRALVAGITGQRSQPADRQHADCFSAADANPFPASLAKLEANAKGAMVETEI